MTFLNALVALLGAREVKRHSTALAGIAHGGERHAWERWGRHWGRVWGFGAILIGLGGMWTPFAVAGWILAGTSPIAATPVPCGFDVVNRYMVLKVLRNLFFVALGTGLIVHGLGLLS